MLLKIFKLKTKQYIILDNILEKDFQISNFKKF